MNQLHKRRIVLAASAVALLATAATVRPTAEFEVLTHEITDKTPRKFQAAVDTGILAVSVLYTWTERTLR
ncbi:MULTISPECIES: hypothetical protein [unclassified Sphingomonas]|uniref:hypothetical protein n=1 Tax=unclassified Sphingomonas TaxID=196159 RepID=UPI00083575A7|nr:MULTISPECIES: hypothetical protein [unclassified Sphingomonas]